MDPLIDLSPPSSVLTLPSTLTLLDPELPPSHEDLLARFEENLSFARSVLDGWGLTFGELTFSSENDQTVRCLL
jgi:hypothetical protein